VKDVPGRVDFDPVPWTAMGIWILTQMKRWGYIKGDVKYKEIVDKVYLLTDAKKRMKEAGIPVPEKQVKKIIVMGKAFDDTKPEAYVDSFKIKKLAV
jgi:nitrate/nitrite transport system substrate-binding protein